MEEVLNDIYSDLKILIKSKTDCRYVLQMGTAEYAEQILSCYDYVRIDDKNIEDKLNADSLNSFLKSGGIFNKLNIDDINKIINSKTDVFVISRANIPAKEVNALLWLSIDTDIYDNLVFYDCIGEDKKELIRGYIRDRKVIYPMDFIAIPGEKNRGVSYPLLCSTYERLYNIGYKYAFIEIYKLKGYFDDKNCYYELNHSNERSVALNKKIGADNIGTIGEHFIKKGQYQIVVKSEVYGLDLYTGIKSMKEKINGQILDENSCFSITK